MAKSSEGKRRPRIRKSAPTVRELAQAAQAQADDGKTKRLSRPASRLKKLNIGQKAPARAAKKPLRLIKRALAWIVPSYFVNSWRELRQVQWPARRETWRLTLAVFVFAIVFGALVAGVDKSLDELFKKVVLK